jgi:hypothetical protein
MVFKSKRVPARKSHLSLEVGLTLIYSVTPIGQIPSTQNMVSTMFVVPVGLLQFR